MSRSPRRPAERRWISAAEAATPVPVNFVELKLSLEAATGLSQDALHIYAALLIQLVVGAVTRRGLAHPLPWLVVLAAELANEWADLRAYPGVFEVQAWKAFHDVWNTMLLPTLLLAIARLAPWLLRPGRLSARDSTGGEQVERLADESP